MTLCEKIFNYLDDGSTILVFPTENTARHYLARYVRERRTSVLASRAMAFDSFRSMFSPRHKEKPADKYNRLAFVASFLDSGSTGLCYLYKDSLHDNSHRFVSFLSRILPQLSEMEQARVSEKALYSDLQILRSRYSEYLERSNLFEPGWEKHSLEYAPPSFSRNRYVLAGYDAEIPMQMLMSELGNVSNIGTLELDWQVPDVSYRQYYNEEAELEDLFQTLQKLKRTVNADDIILSSPRLEELSTRLERKALEYNIPLSFMKSMKIAQTVPGKYLYAIKRCIEEDMSFHSLENLFLDASLPFVHMDWNRILIRFMIDNNVQSGSLKHSDALIAELGRKYDEETRNIARYYKDARSAVSAISRAKDGDELIKDIHGLTCLLLGNDEFGREGSGSGYNETDRDVYSFIFNELGNLSRTLKESGLAMNSIFSIFMREVDGLSYVSQEKTEGIRVYSYGQDFLIDSRYHFVFGLNESSSGQRRQMLSFLEDYEIDWRKDYDATDRLIEYYMSVSPVVWISGSETSYAGSESVPNRFVSHPGSVERHEAEDVAVFEKPDARSLAAALDTQLAPKGRSASEHDCPVLAHDPGSIRFSYSSIDTYAKCPYRALMTIDFMREKGDGERGSGYVAPEQFEPGKQDDAKMGQFLHDVIQTFMARHFNEVLADDEQGIAQYNREIEEIMDDLLSKTTDFDTYTKRSLKATYLEAVQKGVEGLLVSQTSTKVSPGCIGPFKPLENELALDGNPSYIGYIDTVIESVEGNTYLLDYKKGDAKATYQLILYKQLYEEQHPGSEISDCFFYSMKDGRYKGFDKAEKYSEQEQKLAEDCDKARNGYSNGIWEATPGKEACMYCRERGICRRRFNLQ